MPEDEILGVWTPVAVGRLFDCNSNPSPRVIVVIIGTVDIPVGCELIIFFNQGIGIIRMPYVDSEVARPNTVRGGGPKAVVIVISKRPGLTIVAGGLEGCLVGDGDDIT